MAMRSGEPGSPELFGDRLADLVAARQSQLVVGLDPDPAQLWPQARQLADHGGSGGSPAMRAAFAVAAHCELVLDAVAGVAVGVKFQVACFERLGAAGWAALAEAVRRAHHRDLMVIADAKRGDIDVTAAAYAQAYFGAIESPFGEFPSLEVDALTVNPLLGRDSLHPPARAAREHGGGLFVLVRTSNPGAADLQERRLDTGGTVSERLAEMVRELGRDAVGRSGLADIGAVVAATAPERVAGLRELMPEAVFLLPGVGVQGGKVQALASAWGSNRASALITASRGIVSAHLEAGGDPAEAARAQAERLRALAWDMTG